MPRPKAGAIQLFQASLSQRIGHLFCAESFDGITAGLSVAYADHWNPNLKKWDDAAYLQLLRDVFLLLRKGGSFVFSSNIPHYDYVLLALMSWRQILLTWKFPLALIVTLIMLNQSRWLRECARKGRFHYLPAETIINELRSIGFKEVKYQLSYAKQAWVFLAIK
jgi:hypothetical protein